MLGDLKIDDVEKHAVHVKVDLKHPERNREVYVFPVENIPGLEKNLFYSGFMLMLAGFDARWTLVDQNKEYLLAKVIAPNKILLQIPAMAYTIMNDRNELQKHLPTFLANAMDNARFYFKKSNLNCEFKYIVLEFDDEFELSSSVISHSAGENETLAYQAFPVQSTCSELGINNLEYWVYWVVARVDVEAKVHGDTNGGMSKFLMQVKGKQP